MTPSWQTRSGLPYTDGTMNPRIVECVPNFSEGKDRAVLDAIAAAVRKVEGVELLDVDPGASTNRTVFTFAGEPEPVCEAAFQSAKVAFELIDMRHHQGEHPRFGALDVCPLVPVSGITKDETVTHARGLGERIASELGVPIYFYGEAASTPQRRDLSVVRAGEYEGLPAKLQDPAWKPDFGPAEFVPKYGATAVGVRDFLIAFNVNLNTTSTRRANSVAFDLRERGRVKRTGNPITGEIARDAEGNPEYIPGALRSVRAIGWFIEEYGFAQVSMNLTDLSVTPLHLAFDVACEKAAERGMRVTGSEIVGLVPLGSMLEAGRYFLRKQRRSVGLPDSELIRVAIKSMGLDELGPFDPSERIVEYALGMGSPGRLVSLSVKDFLTTVASESSAPGGGSASALAGALGASLGAMVANLSSHKRGWDDRWEEFSGWAERASSASAALLGMVDEDTAAFDSLMAAFALPKESADEKKRRSEAIQAATRRAIEAPLRVARLAAESLDVLRQMALEGNPNSASDAGVGAILCKAAVQGAALNVRTNLSGLKDASFAESTREEIERLLKDSSEKADEISAIVEEKL